MKIYSNHITERDVRNAFSAARRNHNANIFIGEMKTWQPRDYANGIEVFAESFDGKYVTGHIPAHASGSVAHYPKAPSWNDWGYVIAYLYNVDPHARVGFYDNEADFVKKVRAHPKDNSELPFLQVLDNIKEYA